MKFIAFFAFLFLSMQCFASEVMCGEGYSLYEATKALNHQLVNEKNISSPSVSTYNGYKMICVSVN